MKHSSAGLYCLALSLTALLLASAPAAKAAEANPLNGLWQITVGPSNAIAGCKVDRQSWYAQIADAEPGGWLKLYHSYDSFTLQGSKVSAKLKVHVEPEDFAEENRPSQAVADRINGLDLTYRFEGTLSADRLVLTGEETTSCYFWQGDELTGFQTVEVPLRAAKRNYSFGSFSESGKTLASVVPGQGFRLVFDAGKLIGWSAAWVGVAYDSGQGEVIGSDPPIWIKLSPDEDSATYRSPILTFAAPPKGTVDEPAEALEGRLYASPGTRVFFYVYPLLDAIAVTVIGR